MKAEGGRKSPEGELLARAEEEPREEEDERQEEDQPLEPALDAPALLTLVLAHGVLVASAFGEKVEMHDVTQEINEPRVMAGAVRQRA